MGVVGENLVTGDLIPLVRAWRLDEQRPVRCPCCAEPKLDISDRSARPYREWYALHCSSCGFERTVTVSLAAAIPGAD
jgi:hypothetical protein